MKTLQQILEYGGPKISRKDYLKQDDFKPHMMYDPETGKGYKAEKPEDHERMKKMGYTHDKPELEEYTTVSPKMAKVFDSLKVGDKIAYKTKRYSSDGHKVTKKEMLRHNQAGIERITLGKGVYLLKNEKTKEVMMKSGNMPVTITDLVKESVELEEGRMKELHGYIDKGMSAQQIAKKMKLDVKTIKALMSEGAFYGRDDLVKQFKPTKAQKKLNVRLVKNDKKGYSRATLNIKKDAKKIAQMKKDGYKVDPTYHKESIEGENMLPENYRKLARKGMGAEGKKDVKVGDELDFYETGQGNKLFGKVIKVTNTGYTVQAQERNNNKKYTFVFHDRAKAKKLLETNAFTTYLEGARDDARNAFKNDPDYKDKKSKDYVATVDDRKAADKNPVMQLRRIADLPQGGKMEFKDKKSVKLSQADAKKALRGFDTMRKAQDKVKFQQTIGKSLNDFKRILKVIR